VSFGLKKPSRNPSMEDNIPPLSHFALQTIAIPTDTNVNGDIFGGWLMAQMDLGASVPAPRAVWPQ